MKIIELISHTCLFAGAFFFFAGTVALLRFPDVYTRLHALAKTDNVGLAFISLGLLLRTEDLVSGMKLVLVWLLVLASSTAVSFLIARRAMRRGIAYWRVTEKKP